MFLTKNGTTFTVEGEATGKQAYFYYIYGYKSRKNASYLCNWCEYCTCRKGHKCSWYKRQVKKLKKYR